jgi:hypothetical protein
MNTNTADAIRVCQLVITPCHWSPPPAQPTYALEQTCLQDKHV